jgi:hypothetical protein
MRAGPFVASSKTRNRTWSSIYFEAFILGGHAAAFQRPLSIIIYLFIQLFTVYSTTLLLYTVEAWDYRRTLNSTACGRKWPWPDLSLYRYIYLDGLRKTMKISSRPPDRDFTTEIAEYEAGVPTTRRQLAPGWILQPTVRNIQREGKVTSDKSVPWAISEYLRLSAYRTCVSSVQSVLGRSQRLGYTLPGGCDFILSY